MNRGETGRGKPRAAARPLNDYNPTGQPKPSCRTRRGGGQYYPAAQGRHPQAIAPRVGDRGDGGKPP